MIGDMDRATAYDDDIYAWSQQQAAVLRRLAETRRDLPNELDLENVAEEIETVGRYEVRAVESFAEVLLQHLLKVASAPDAQPVRHWRTEIDLQSAGLSDEFRNSMRQIIRLDRIWLNAVARADMALDQHGDALLPALPRSCPLTLDQLLADPFDVDEAIARVRRASADDAPRT